ncbi:hypothetical protein ACFFF7_07375 [Novosphingobium aquiterrae]|uniref:DUF2336 domain-containing protein n=1 Tax=Novosphingobium aquiterrae TaxID=624388 RepID=A0ABV6PHD9_9SPHN
MNDLSVSIATGVSAEDLLREDLMAADAQIGTYGPILRHLLASNEHSIFSDEIIARVRGMVSNLAEQVLDELAQAQGHTADRQLDTADIAQVAAALMANPGLIGHCHALAIEWHLTERLQGRLALDPVLSPLLQALIASSDTATATHAMALLASQARFAQTQRRMQLPQTELPGDLLHHTLVVLRGFASGDPEIRAHTDIAEAAIRSRFDEGRSRLGLIARLVTAMGGGATAALSITHAGTAMFLTALAMASGQERDLAVLSTCEGQYARLALSLRAAGLKPQAVEEQFLALYPDITLPENFDQLGADRAAALIARTNPYPGL